MGSDASIDSSRRRTRTNRPGLESRATKWPSGFGSSRYQSPRNWTNWRSFNGEHGALSLSMKTEKASDSVSSICTGGRSGGLSHARWAQNPQAPTSPSSNSAAHPLPFCGEGGPVAGDAWPDTNPVTLRVYLITPSGPFFGRCHLEPTASVTLVRSGRTHQVRPERPRTRKF